MVKCTYLFIYFKWFISLKNFGGRRAEFHFLYKVYISDKIKLHVKHMHGNIMVVKLQFFLYM